MSRKEILNNIIKEKPEAVLVKNKYKVLVGMIRRMYPNNFEKISTNVWEEIAFELINGDRDLRLLTENFDRENKDKLMEQHREYFGGLSTHKRL